MATTTKQDNDFRDSIISRSLLEDAIDWIRRNMEPEDVFSESQLKDWAEDAGFTEDNGEG